MWWSAGPPHEGLGGVGTPPDGEQAGPSRVSGRLGRTCVSEINVLGSEVAAAASSDQHPADQAGTSGPASDNGTAPRRRGGLSGMVMAELRQLAGQLGLSDIAGMRKNELIAAIKERQGAVPGQRRVVAEQLPLEGASVSTSTQTPTQAKIEATTQAKIEAGTPAQAPRPADAGETAAEQPPAAAAERARVEPPA